MTMTPEGRRNFSIGLRIDFAERVFRLLGEHGATLEAAELEVLDPDGHKHRIWIDEGDRIEDEEEES